MVCFFVGSGSVYPMFFDRASLYKFFQMEPTTSTLLLSICVYITNYLHFFTVFVLHVVMQQHAAA